MKILLKYLLPIIAIISGLFALVKILGRIDLIFASISFTFGILAIIWTLRAKSSLSEGSSLRIYTNYFLSCLILILVFSIWHTITKIFLFNSFAIYIEYILITISYFVFLLAAYKILYIGKEFGFQTKAREIKKILKNKE